MIHKPESLVPRLGGLHLDLYFPLHSLLKQTGEKTKLPGCLGCASIPSSWERIFQGTSQELSREEGAVVVGTSLPVVNLISVSCGKAQHAVGSRELPKGDSSHPWEVQRGWGESPSTRASLQSQDGFRGRLEITLQVAGQHGGVSMGTGHLFTLPPNG